MARLSKTKRRSASLYEKSCRYHGIALKIVFVFIIILLYKKIVNYYFKQKETLI